MKAASMRSNLPREPNRLPVGPPAHPGSPGPGEPGCAGGPTGRRFGSRGRLLRIDAAFMPHRVVDHDGAATLELRSGRNALRVTMGPAGFEPTTIWL